MVNAKVDAAEKPEERVTLLTEARGREAGFLDIVEGRFKAGTITQADVHKAQSLLLATEIRLVRERGKQEEAAQVKALQVRRVDTLRRLVALYTLGYELGTHGVEVVVDAKTELINAQSEATDNHEDRVALLTELVKVTTERLRTTEARQKAGIATEAAVLQARSLFLDAKIRLLRERGTQKAATK